ncbi:MAG: trypsin-like serine protease [Myxococcales bacterium]|nr:trypsin-like serine protease [Myxococcales bacterium]
MRRMSCLLVLLVGCATEEATSRWDEATVGDPTDNALHQKLVNGRLTFDRPEIGRLQTPDGLCTATLIRPDVILTAAHCVRFETREGAIGSFVIERGPDERAEFAVEAVVSYASSGPGPRDLALGRLAKSVPANIARPAALATKMPAEGDAVTWFGYGCNDRNRPGQAPTGQKQKLAFAFQRSNNSCAGDSGGPTVVGHDGPVFRVTSGFNAQSGDLFGDVIALRSRLDAQADAWTRVVEAPPAAPPPLGRPTVRRAGLQGDWIYLEWTPVAGEQSYVQFVIAESADGGVGPFVYRMGEGADDRGDFLYWYFHRATVCRAIRAGGLPAGEHRLWVQVWPGRDDTRAESAKLAAPLICD